MQSFELIVSAVGNIVNPHAENSSSEVTRKRGNYNRYSPEIRAKIGKYTSENGDLKDIYHFKAQIPNLTFKKTYMKELREKKREKIQKQKLFLFHMIHVAVHRFFMNWRANLNFPSSGHKKKWRSSLPRRRSFGWSKIFSSPTRLWGRLINSNTTKNLSRACSTLDKVYLQALQFFTQFLRRCNFSRRTGRPSIGTSKKTSGLWGWKYALVHDFKLNITEKKRIVNVDLCCIQWNVAFCSKRTYRIQFW